jgi:RND family efflux transporter MFP subunit
MISINEYRLFRILTSLMVLAVLSSISLADSQPDSQPDSVFTVKTQDYPNWFTLEAKMEAVNESTLSAQTSGQIQSINVDVNDYVSQGDIIIQLRDTQQRASVEQAQAGLTQAKANAVDAKSKLDQSTPLFKQGSISKGEFDSITANSLSAAAAVLASNALLRQVDEQLSYTQIRAPYTGIVKSRLVQIGESVNPGTPLMVGLSLADLRAVADIPQRLMPSITDNKNLQVIHNNVVIKAKKVTLFPYANASSHSFKVRVAINAEGHQLFPGMWVKLNIPIGSKKALRVPKSAVMQKGELSSVYVKTASGFKLRQVRLGELTDDHVTVLAGLRNGEMIATDGYGQMEKMEIK